MPRYLIERTFYEEFSIPDPSQAEQTRLLFIGNNIQANVVWVQSYISPDRKKSYCIYEAPSPEALRRAAQLNRLPIDRIIEVRLLDPYLFIPTESGLA